MKRIVHVIGRNGKEYDIPLTAEQAAFYLRLAAFKALKDPTINFSVLVAEQREKELQRPTRFYNEASQENEYPDVLRNLLDGPLWVGLP